MMKRTIVRCLLPLSLLLGACSGDATGASDTSIRAHRARWDGQHLSSYSFVFQQSCFCPHTEAVVVEVRGGQVTGVRDRATGQPLVGAREPAGAWPTMDDLFDQLAATRAAGLPLEVHWNEARGYPASAVINNHGPADDGGAWSVADLQPL
ncbi:MAG: hypothetical protein JWM27_3236 [Gemmatimonadetes bacterium]|nr:hypothetical protein [Gemmatimonadota bacterium]